MINSKKKAQISIEALIIVGVLVIGGVIFASVYLNNLGVHTKRSSELSGLTDGFMNDLSGWNDTPGTPGTGSTPTCSDSIQNQGEIGIDCGGPCPACMTPGTCNNGIQDGLETGTDCGGTCPPCATPGEFIISLVLNPASSSPKNIDFKIHVLMTNATGQPKEVLKSIEITDDYTTLPTTKCSFNGTNASSFNNLNIPFNGVREMVLSFSCKDDGNYSFAIEAGILGDTTPEYNDTQNVVKEIKSTAIGCAVSGVCGPTDTCPTCPECCTVLGDIFSVKIAVPENQKYFFREDRTDFIAVLNPEKKAGETDSCVWYVNESKEIPIGSQPDSCRLEGISLNDTSLFAEGLNTITVYAQRSTLAAGKKLEANAKIEINILKPINPEILYLSAPRNLIVGESFNLKVYGITEGQVNATRNISNFTFTGNKCAITSATPVCGSTTVNSTNVYYCDYPAVCSSASYAQTSPYDPSEVVASLQGTSETARFYSEYDLLFYSGNCSVTATSYGKMNTCVSSINGMGHNVDYWTDPSYGLLKTSINVSSSIIENNYGILKIYIE